MNVQEVFKNIAEDVVTVKSQISGYKSYENGAWGGNLAGLLNTDMYAVKMNNDRTLRVVGTGANQAITIHNGWNWIGYQGRQVVSLGDALVGLVSTLTDGDILKAQRGVAYWDDYEWSGSLLMMEPGSGYQLKSNAAGSLDYPESTRRAGSETFLPVNFRKYPDNAIMTARLVVNGMPLNHASVAVFADGECRTTAVTDAEGMAFLTIPGNESCELTFKVAVGDEVVDVPFTLTYETDAIFGSPCHPVVIDLGESNGIWEIVNDNKLKNVYDLSGRKVISGKSDNTKLRKGVYIINGQKKTVK